MLSGGATACRGSGGGDITSAVECKSAAKAMGLITKQPFLESTSGGRCYYRVEGGQAQLFFDQDNVECSDVKRCLCREHPGGENRNAKSLYPSDCVYIYIYIYIDR